MWDEMIIYVQNYWLPIVLLIGLAVAVTIAYIHWDKIEIRGSGRK
ncbi:hypothetical protein [Paenibacillus piri]|nr:hypothetical protein [Paenibacillus piri]